MYVHIEVLEGRGCLKDLGAHGSDRIVVRVGEPKNTAAMASETLAAPIVNTVVGVTVPDKVSAKIKRQINKRAFKRDLNKYQLRLYTLKHRGDQDETQEPTWLGIVAFRLLCLTDGYVVERWVPMQPATKTEPGALRVRLVVRESEADALAVLANADVTTHSTPSEGCCCDVCDPHFQLAKPLIEVFEFDEKHLIPNRAGRVIAAAMVCTIS